MSQILYNFVQKLEAAATHLEYLGYETNCLRMNNGSVLLKAAQINYNNMTISCVRPAMLMFRVEQKFKKPKLDRGLEQVKTYLQKANARMWMTKVRFAERTRKNFTLEFYAFYAGEYERTAMGQFLLMFNCDTNTNFRSGHGFKKLFIDWV